MTDFGTQVLSAGKRTMNDCPGSLKTRTRKDDKLVASASSRLSFRTGYLRCLVDPLQRSGGSIALNTFYTSKSLHDGNR